MNETFLSSLKLSNVLQPAFVIIESFDIDIDR